MTAKRFAAPTTHLNRRARERSWLMPDGTRILMVNGGTSIISFALYELGAQALVICTQEDVTIASATLRGRAGAISSQHAHFEE